MDHDPNVIPDNRSLANGPTTYAIVGANRSVLYAAKWLREIGANLLGSKSIEAALKSDEPLAILIAGDGLTEPPASTPGTTCIYLWDYEVGRPGTGAFASAVSGVSSVIGRQDGAPGVLPNHLPEQWAGLFGANLALSLQFAQPNARPARIDISAADILRSFAEQNSGNHAGVPYGWRRNGRTAVEHGGVFPQGFFRCKDGFVAVQARSKQDWGAILQAFGNPDWAADPLFQNPFKLSEQEGLVMPHLDAELMQRSRVELLNLAIETGAPMAPVLTAEEAASWDVFRPGFREPGSSSVRLPFLIRQ